MCKHCSGSALRNRGGSGDLGGTAGAVGTRAGTGVGTVVENVGTVGTTGRERRGGVFSFSYSPHGPHVFYDGPHSGPRGPHVFLQGSTYLGPQEIPQGRLQTGAGFSQDLSHRLTREILTAPLLLASQPRARALSQPAQYNASSHLPRPRERKVRPRPLPCQS